MQIMREASAYNPTNPRGWHCDIRNNENIPITMKISAICLESAP
jgi:hypothetical protein